jgi:protein TonB
MYLRSFSVAAMLLVIASNSTFAQQSQPSSEVWAQYKYNMTSLIAKAVRYPEAACQERLEGVALVAFIVAADGRIMSRRITKSSGHAVLDREALQAIDRVKALPPFPPFVKERQLNFDVPLRFNWARFLGLLKLPVNCKPLR